MDFNMRPEERMEQVQLLAEEAIHNSRVSFLGLLCGDLSPQVVWKMMYLSQHLQSVEEKCTLLNILTDYIVNTPSLLEEDSKIYKLHSPRNMIQTLSDCWSILLPQAVDALSDESFVNFKRNLINSSLTLEKYSLHHDLDSVAIPQQNDDDTFRVESRTPVFPNNASIPVRKLTKIRSTRNLSSPATPQQTSMTSSTTARTASSTASAIYRPASAKATRPASITATVPDSVTSDRPDSVTSTRPASVTPARPSWTETHATQPKSPRTPTAIARSTLVATISKPPVTVPTTRPIVAIAGPATSVKASVAVVKRSQVATSKQASATSSKRVLGSPHTKKHAPTAIPRPPLNASTTHTPPRTVSPSARRLILAGLERLHLVRSSPAMPIFSRSPKTSATSTVKPTATEQNVDDLRKSVHSKSMKSSLHPKMVSVTRELYFNPQ